MRPRMLDMIEWVSFERGLLLPALYDGDADGSDDMVVPG